MTKSESGKTEETARAIRQKLGVDQLSWLDPMTLIVKLKRLISGFNFALVEASAIPGALAQWDAEVKLIKIRRDIFESANGYRADGRARFSIFHEIVHAMQGDQGTLNRALSRTDIPKYARKLRAIEGDTDQITGALMAPRHLVLDDYLEADVAFRFGMSSSAAKIRLEEIRGRRPEARQLPDSIKQLLLDLSSKSPRGI